MARLIGGFLVFMLLIGLIGATYPGKLFIRYFLILFTVSLIVYSGYNIAYLLDAVGNASLSSKAEGAGLLSNTGSTTGIIKPL